MFFCCLIHIETAQNSREECNEFSAYLLFFILTLCLSRDSLSCDTRSLVFYSSLFFYTSNAFRPILARFSHIYFTPYFILCTLPREIFFLSLMTLLLGIYLLFLISSVKGLIWTIFFFLTFIALIQWNFPWNISANVLIFSNKASSHVVIV